MVNPKTLVVINVIDSNPYLTKAICLPHIKISINGHSLSGVNPEGLLIGGTTTLAMA
jgi:hypothetical protein